MSLVNTVRAKLHDTAGENTFLKKEEFSTLEIEAAAQSALSYWNSTRPLVSSLKYDAWADVPPEYHERFYKGIMGVLLSDKSHGLSRNRQPVQVEGVGMDPEARVQVYLELGQGYIAEFIQWITVTKHNLAVNGVVTSSPSVEASFFNIPSGVSFSTSFEILGNDGDVIAGLNTYEKTLVIYPEAGGQTPLLEVTLGDTTGNKATLELSDEDITWSGIAQGEIKLVKENETKYRIRVYISVNPSLEDPEQPTVDALRDSLRDRVGDNSIFGGQEFTNVELAMAIIQAVRYWNSAPPILRGYRYSPISITMALYPHVMEAATGYALKAAARKLLRNSLGSIDPLSVDLKERAQTYQGLGEMLVREWEEWVRDTKYRINISSSFGMSSMGVFG